MKYGEILNLIALIIVPIIAVMIGQYLQDRAKKREDKMDIFKALMTSRAFGWTNASVYALNTIEIVFANNKAVLQQWKVYYDKLCIEKPTETDLKKIQTERDKLIETIAKSLGYKNKITWETIQNPYIPKGMIDSLEQQQKQQNNQVEIMETMKVMMQGNVVQQDKKEGDLDG